MGWKAGWTRTVLGAAAFLGVYVAAAWVGVALPGLALVSPWWLPSALGMWLLVRHGLGWLPVTLAAELVTTAVVFHGRLDTLGLTAALVKKLAYAAPAWWLRRRYGAFPRLTEPGTLLAVLLAGTAGAVLSAATGPSLMIWQGIVPAGQRLDSTRLWFAGDAVGALVLLPLLLTVGTWRHDGGSRRSLNPRALNETALAVAAPLPILLWAPSPEAYLYVLLLPAAWISLRRGLIGGLGAAFALDTLMTVTVAVRGSAGIAVGEMQLFITAVTVTVAFMGAVATRNRELTHHLEQRVVDRTAELAMANAALQHAAFHDPLTGLANRALFTDRLKQALTRHTRDSAPLGVVFCDLDDFKAINDTCGHGTGDELLRQVAARLATTVRSTDTLARLGGDEFAVLVDGDAAAAALVTGRISAALRTPLAVQRRTLRIGISTGVCLVPSAEVSPTPAHVMSQADVAMYAAKQAGKNQVVIWDDALHSNEVDQLGLRNDLAQAVSDGQITVAYQPIVDARDGHAVAVEALARWQRHGTIVSPSVFIAAAEKAGLLGALSEQVLSIALRDLPVLARHFGNPQLSLSANLAAEQLQDADFPRRVQALLAQHELDPARLTCEITEERLLISCERRAPVGLDGLAALGVQLALDDFGAGFSGLAHLAGLPLNILKIDRLFLPAHDQDRQTQFLRGIVDLVHRLQLRTIIEGVETADQLELVRAVGCQYVQGYLTGRPRSLAELTAGIATKLPSPRSPACANARRT